MLRATLILLFASQANALTGREVIEQAQARNGFSTWHDRRSLVTLEPFYISALRPLLDCGSVTRVPVIVGTPPALLALGALALLVVMHRG